MKNFLFFTVALLALLVFLFNLGPLIILGASIWLLYIIFKQFMKSDTTSGRIGWVVLGLLVLSIGLSNVFAIAGIVAAIVLYMLYKHWKKTDGDVDPFDGKRHSDDPFTNFEREWDELNQY
ncbi:MAG TPA: flagellar basal body rod protein [Bacillota bacterium]|nr:flagellar basal body rod protein [Bacillota bacterium]